MKVNLKSSRVHNTGKNLKIQIESLVKVDIENEEATGYRIYRRELENKDSELDKSSHRNKI